MKITPMMKLGFEYASREAYRILDFTGWPSKLILQYNRGVALRNAYEVKKARDKESRAFFG